MRTWTVLLIVCLGVPVAAGALPGAQLSLPISDAGMAGAALDAGPVKFSSAMLVVPGTVLKAPVGSGEVRTADTAATARVGGGASLGVADESLFLPVPLLPDGMLYAGVGTFHGADGFGARFSESILFFGRDLAPGFASPASREPAPGAPLPGDSDATDRALRGGDALDAPSAVPVADARTEAGSKDTFTQANVALDRPSLITRSMAVAAATGLGLLALLGLALYSRIKPSATLKNDTRKAIFEAVCENPGMGVQPLAKAANVSYSTATYHLERLAGAGMIVMTPDGNKLRYYKNGGTFSEAERRILPLLKNQEAARVLEAIVAEPGTIRTQLAARLGVTTTTINWHLRRLFEAGLVTENREGRSAYLFPSGDASPSLRSIAEKLASDEPPVAELARRCAKTTAGAS